MDGLGRVVVVGNSFAGLLTATALAPHADSVTIVDRDRIPSSPELRAGVPQARHIHVVLAGGQRALDSLLPGVVDELAAQGVPMVAHPRDVLQLNRGLWVPRWSNSSTLLTGTRPLVEHVVRRRVLADPRITTLDATEAVGLHGDGRRVRGVMVRARGGQAPGEVRVLAADLVVDASGRSSRTPQWLTALGAAAPAEERIETGLAYATRVYRAAQTDGDYRGIYLVPHQGMTRSGVIMPIEEPGLFLVTVTGLAGDEPPTDPEAFTAFADRLEHPVVAEWLARAQPQGPPVGHRATANVRRRYDRLDGPEGLLVVGDAFTAVNPIYGQGITVAAMGATELGRAVAAGERSLRRLQRIVKDAGEQAWTISGGVDKSMPGATGNAARAGVADRIARWYLGRVQDYTVGHPHVAAAFRNVLHLVAPATSLFAWPVARTVLFGRRPTPLPEPPRYLAKPSIEV